jgi:anhydro-N-acetylmuramic acid kinase
MEYKVIGLMSGTSLDGLDIAACHFNIENGQWSFDILQAETVTYSPLFVDKLRHAHTLSAYNYVCLDNEIAQYWGQEVKQFIHKQKITFDFIASHGHTIFHQPDKNITTQIGNGAILAAICHLPVVCDFRTTDVALGGQGAPLVPIGDSLLFGNHDFCLNLGGIANISMQLNQKRIAYDVCPANMALNFFANQLGHNYDEGGEMARSGNFNLTKPLFDQLNQLDFYAQSFPKSLGREWVAEKFMPCIDSYLLANQQVTTQDILACLTHHTAYQIAKTIKNIELTSKNKENTTLFITGGGAFNSYLVELLKNYAPSLEIIIPNQTLIQFKEALIFAFLGVLRWRNETNALQSVTGASRDSCGGCVYVG